MMNKKMLFLGIGMGIFGINNSHVYAEKNSRNESNKPNIVLVLMDNMGWGELGCYGGGILRGAPTPNIDRIASEGTRLLNFNVEAQCTPSRASLLTGRYAIRTGNGSIPLEGGLYGLTQWEETLPEMLSNQGYATAAYGKWHLGQTTGRYPTNNGFDEWYGIPNSSDECFWADNDRFREEVDKFARKEYIMTSTRDKEPQKLKVYDIDARTKIDRELINKGIRFMEQKSKEHKPFFLYLPMTQMHVPTYPSPEFKGKTGNGYFADVLAQTDAYMGELTKAIDRLGIADNTIFIFTSDNGPEAIVPHHGSSGPWRGTYFTALEGSLRVPFIVRWPGHIPAGRISNEIVHEMDIFPTISDLLDQEMPRDRIIDGVSQLDFIEGKSDTSNREGFVIYVGNAIYGVKWRNWKMMLKDMSVGYGDHPQDLSVPTFIDLYTDPKEEHPMDPRWIENTWVRWPCGKILTNHRNSFKKEPAIKPGITDDEMNKRRVAN